MAPAALLVVLVGDVWPQVPLERPSGQGLQISRAVPPAGPSPAGTGRVSVHPVRRATVAMAAASQVRPERPTSIRLPGGRHLRIDTAATARDGVLGVPADVDRAGWWDGSSRLGDPYGAIVVAGHVDSVSEGIGPFAELLGMRRGQTVRLTGARHSQRFEVVSVTSQPRTALSATSPVLSPHGDRRLVLVTCGGPYDDQGGYRDNVIVIAAPRGGLQPVPR